MVGPLDILPILGLGNPYLFPMDNLGIDQWPYQTGPQVCWIAYVVISVVAPLLEPKIIGDNIGLASAGHL